MTNLPLWDYQERALEKTFANFAAGQTRGLLALATGAGKTITAAHLIERAHDTVGTERTVFLVHRDELARQAIETLSESVPGLDVGLVKAQSNQVDAPVVVASVQTLVGPKRFAQLRDSINGAPLLVVSDEAHHDGPKTIRAKRILELDPRMLVGLTATPNRGDRAGLDHLYEVVHEQVGIVELIARDKLSPMVGLRVETSTDLAGVRVVAGEFVEKDLASAVNTPTRNALVVQSYQKHCAGRQRTVAFCVDVAHANAMRDAFRSAGIRSEVILGETPEDERRQILLDFREGRIPVLSNCMVLTEGYDEPGIDAILMCRPTKSQGLYIQCAGRGARKAKGKTDCLVIDFVDNSAKHSLVQFPQLAGIAQGAPGKAGDEPEVQRSLLGLAMDDERVRVERELRVNLFSGSPFIWQEVGPYVMAVAGASQWVTLMPSVREPDRFVPVRLVWAGEQSKAVRLFDRPLDFSTAIAVAESKVPPGPLTVMNSRRPGPATKAQLDNLRRLKLRVQPGVSRLEASNAISAELFRRAMARVGLGRVMSGRTGLIPNVPCGACGHSHSTSDPCGKCPCRDYRPAQVKAYGATPDPSKGRRRR